MESPDSYLRKLRQLFLALQEGDLNLAANMEQASQQLHIKFGSSGGCSSSQGTEIPPIALKRLPGRGLGAIATRLIPAGRIILMEKAILTIPESTNKSPTPDYITSLVDHYTKLPVAIRQQLLCLYAYRRPVQENKIRDLLNTGSGDLKLTEPQIDFILRLHSTFATNSFEAITPSTRSLYLAASHFNHSCLPNCDFDHTPEGSLSTITVCASRDIQPGEEVVLRYLNIYQPRDKRRAYTKRIWGFVCNCPACDTADATVDTVLHEQRLAEYLRLKQDTGFAKLVYAKRNAMSLEDLDKLLRRSTQRAQIAGEVGDYYNVLQE